MVKTNQLLAKIRSLLENKGLELLYVNNRQPDDKRLRGVRIMSMHRGKGMEFSYVYLPSLQQGILPSYRDIERAKDDEALKEVKLKEANLLSVAITRAKRQVWLSYSGRPSELIMGYIS